MNPTQFGLARSINGLSSLNREEREKLLLKDIQTVDQALKEVDLVIASKIKDEINDIPNPISFEQLEKEKKLKLSLGCESLNNLFSEKKRNKRKVIDSLEVEDIETKKGLSLTGITEISGVSGTGKTTLCIQLALNAMKLEDKDGDGKVLFIDTEGGLLPFIPKILEMATHKGLDQQKAINNLIAFRSFDHEELIETLESLDDVFKSETNINLIVIDSLSLPFQYRFKTFASKRAHINHVGSLLLKLAINYKVPVIVTTSLAIFPGNNHLSAADYVISPALGEPWAHFPKNVLLLGYQKKSKRIAYLKESSTYPSDTASYYVTDNGIEDSKPFIPSEHNQNTPYSQASEHTPSFLDHQTQSSTQLSATPFYPNPSLQTQNTQELPTQNIEEISYRSPKKILIQNPENNSMQNIKENQTQSTQELPNPSSPLSSLSDLTPNFPSQ